MNGSVDAREKTLKNDGDEEMDGTHVTKTARGKGKNG